MACQEFPFAREKANDPPPVYAKLRREDPVSKVKLPNGHFAWLLTRHEDIREALSSGKLSANPHAPGYPEIYHRRRGGITSTKSTLVTVDGHEHARLRGAIDADFTPEAVEKLRPLIHSVVDEALDVINRRYVKKERPFDLVEEFAAPVPMRIICRIVGVPAPDVVWLSQDTALGTEHPRDAAEDEKQVLVRYVQRLVHEGLISELIRLHYETNSLSRDEIAQLLYVVLTAGNAALINSISLGVLTLFENEGELHKVRRNPLALAPGLAAECLRYNSTSALDCRRAVTEDVTLAGTTISKGEGIICAVQSADRDDRAIDRPDVFDPQRKYPVHDVLGLGYGAHRCLGEHLAKAELEVALGTLFARFPGLKLHGSAEELEFTSPKDNMGVLRLPVSVDPNVQLHRIHMPD
ncbi:cytochrome P450 [Xylaria sp. FL0043]|nr:cytochrome P450 [Xylaria sp. FL0043]